ncbi:MAG: hypothetical protein P8R54_16980 [Myxococcota bacterium]|nr:hypothetical protein [Myxococcota bacterium]
MLSALLSACLPMNMRPSVDAPPPPAFLSGPVRIEQVYLEGAIVFADELHPIEDAAADFLAEHGYTVLSRTAQDDHLGAWSDCLVPPIPSRRLSEGFPDTATARLEARCDGDCVLTLTTFTEPSLKPWGVTARWQAPLSGPPELASVLAALPMLVPAERVEPVPETPIVRPSTTTRGVSIQRLRVSGGWSASGLSGALSEGVLDGCWTSGQRDPRSNPIVFSVDSGGVVSRCDAMWPLRLPQPETDCVCGRLAEVDLGAGASDRRGAFVTQPHQPPAVNASGQVISAALGRLYSGGIGLTHAGAGIGHHALSACLARADHAEQADIAVQLEVDANGETVAAAADWPAWAMESEACLDELLSTARFSCSSSGAGGFVTTTIQIQVR